MELKVTDIREPNNPASIVKAFININYHGKGENKMKYLIEVEGENINFGLLFDFIKYCMGIKYKYWGIASPEIKELLLKKEREEGFDCGKGVEDD